MDIQKFYDFVKDKPFYATTAAEDGKPYVGSIEVSDNIGTLFYVGELIDNTGWDQISRVDSVNVYWFEEEGGRKSATTPYQLGRVMDLFSDGDWILKDLYQTDANIEDAIEYLSGIDTNLFFESDGFTYKPKLNIRFKPALTSKNELKPYLDAIMEDYPGIEWYGGSQIYEFDPVSDDDEVADYNGLTELTVGYFKERPDALTYSTNYENEFPTIDADEWMELRKIDTDNLFNQLYESEENDFDWIDAGPHINPLLKIGANFLINEKNLGSPQKLLVRVTDIEFNEDSQSYDIVFKAFNDEKKYKWNNYTENVGLEWANELVNPETKNHWIPISDEDVSKLLSKGRKSKKPLKEDDSKDMENLIGTVITFDDNITTADVDRVNDYIKNLGFNGLSDDSIEDIYMEATDQGLSYIRLDNSKKTWWGSYDMFLRNHQNNPKTIDYKDFLDIFNTTFLDNLNESEDESKDHEPQVGDYLYCHTDLIMNDDDSVEVTKGKTYKITDVNSREIYIKNNTGYEHSFTRNGNESDYKNWFHIVPKGIDVEGIFNKDFFGDLYESEDDDNLEWTQDIVDKVGDIEWSLDEPDLNNPQDLFNVLRHFFLGTEYTIEFDGYRYLIKNGKGDTLENFGPNSFNLENLRRNIFDTTNWRDGFDDRIRQIYIDFYDVLKPLFKLTVSKLNESEDLEWAQDLFKQSTELTPIDVDDLKVGMKIVVGGGKNRGLNGKFGTVIDSGEQYDHGQRKTTKFKLISFDNWYGGYDDSSPRKDHWSKPNPLCKKHNCWYFTKHNMDKGITFYTNKFLNESEDDGLEWAREVLSEPAKALVIGQDYKVRLDRLIDSDNPKGYNLHIRPYDINSDYVSYLVDNDSTHRDTHEKYRGVRVKSTSKKHGEHLVESGYWIPIPREESIINK